MAFSGQANQPDRADAPVALVTGGGRGIGRATATALAAKGYRLVLVSRNSEELNASLAAAGGGGITVQADVTSIDAVDAAVRTAVEQFGRLDAIVHCAGLAPVRSLAETTAAEWHATIDTNLSAAFYLCRAAWPTFARQRAGVVVLVSSAAARDPFPGFAAYGAAKAGLHLLALSAAREGAPIGVRVHTVAPSAVETAMFRQILTHEQYPTEKTLAPAEVARVIGQCVDGDLKHTSGEVVYVHK